MKIKVDTRELREFQEKLRKMSQKAEVVKLQEDIAKDLAARLLRKVIKRTPVGTDVYIDMLVWRRQKDGTAKVVKNKDGTPKVKSTRVYGFLRSNWRTRNGKIGLNVVSIEVSNNVFYASYVEYGHRQTPGRYVPAIGKRLVNNWVDGKFMLRISTQEVRAVADNIAKKHLEEFIRRQLSD